MNNKTLNIKEGGSDNYFNGLEKAFNVKRIGNRFDFREGKHHVSVINYKLFDDFEMMVHSLNVKDNWTLERIPDEQPDFYHFALISEGSLRQDFSNEEHLIEAGSNKGMFIYNGLFPLKTHFPNNTEYKSIVFKFSKTAFTKSIPDSLGILESLFEGNEAKAYHTSIPVALQKVIEDLFLYQQDKLTANILVTSKGLELFALLIKSVKKLLDDDELNGLHIDDYNRVLQIKDEIIKHVEGKINIEDIASQFAISVSKLQRDFKALYNCTVYNFFTQAKMDEAQRRLRSGQYSVTEVGYDLGYSSISKFSTMFKKMKGINPSDVIPI
ncbi:helix-turn-helix domain-containing protein [Carboxylicivirga linearis]|uniref:Helix-turn-helix transcriptional regulator n=1 Tax=Carboxylicivirga linearis TaxID=1628157 RepID=A0ABS5K018_9BACT|nr:helix-turn-helix domain-containing protein [Carboxylicivirga linearis]MBS2100499.1 helix-turn-helix transcriptional regulator [Carboxylicivirga linearis]